MLDVHDSSRLEQLEALSTLELQRNPILIHGSVAHAVLMGLPLPSEIMPNSKRRDVDLFAIGIGQQAIEGYIDESGFDAPNPVDASASLLIEKRGSRFILRKREVEVELEDVQVFQEQQTYTIPESGGRTIRSLTPTGMRALHGLEPWSGTIRPDHVESDTVLMKWFYNNGVILPKRLQKCINKFRQHYNEAYPYSDFYLKLRRIYHKFTPESVRNRLKPLTRVTRLKFTGDKI